MLAGCARHCDRSTAAPSGVGHRGHPADRSALPHRISVGHPGGARRARRSWISRCPAESRSGSRAHRIRRRRGDHDDAHVSVDDRPRRRTGHGPAISDHTGRIDASGPAGRGDAAALWRGARSILPGRGGFRVPSAARAMARTNESAQ